MTRLSAAWAALWRAIPPNAGWILFFLTVPTFASIAAIYDPATGGVRLRVDASADRLLPLHAPARAVFDRAQRQFGSDRAIVVVVGAPDVFDGAVLAGLVRATERVAALPEAGGVLSLANAPDVRATEEGDVAVEPFLAALPPDRAGRAALRESVLGNPLYGGTLVAKDGRATVIAIGVAGISDDALMRTELDRRVLEEVRAAFAGVPDVDLWLTGGPHIQAEGARVLLAESLTLPLASLALLGAVLVLAFRTLRGVLVPIATIGLAVLWTLGVAAAIGHALNAVTVLVPPLLITLGLSYAVHVVSESYEEARLHPGRSQRETVAEALRGTATPLFTCGLTTAVGFGSLCLSPLEAVREFGWLSLAGTVFSLIASLTFAPAVLALLPPPRKLPPASGGGLSAAVDRACRALARFDVDRRQFVFAAALAVLAVSLVGALQLRVGTQQIEKFASDAPVRRSFEAVNERFGGVNPLTIVLETDRTEGFKDPENLRAIEAFQEWLEAQPEIGGTTSVADYVKVAHRAFAGGGADALAIPATRGLVSQILFAAGGDELARFVDAGFESAAVQVRAKVVDSSEVAALTLRIEARLRELPEELRGTVTGSSVVFNQALDEIIRGQAWSLVTGLGVIYLILSVTFLSARIGLVALIPNALPIAFYFGLLGWTGITLSPGTSLVAPIVLGIAVDDTIHYFARFIDDAKRLASERQATESALRAVGWPVTTTALALVSGFLVLNLSDFSTQGQLGNLAAATLGFGWLCDLTLTPALCARLKIVTIWELLALDLGSEPQRTISLLRGLTTAEARIVALMGSLEPVKAGARLWSEGEPADALYIVIDGALRASVKRNGSERELAVHRRGDVLGEVGLLQQARTADVDVLEDGRLLRFTEPELARLARRYPRIASRVLANLSQILAARLARLTERFAEGGDGPQLGRN